MSFILEAIYFPLKNKSLKMLLYISALYALHHLFIHLPVISLVSLTFIGYIYATQFKIIFTTGNGYTDAPEFPEFSNFLDNVLAPLLKVALVWLTGFSLYIIYMFSETESEILFWGSLAFGFLYVPMGLMIAAME